MNDEVKLKHNEKDKKKNEIRVYSLTFSVVTST
jgi:hypothetical protein